MNSVALIGRLTRDPELRYLPNGGTAICKFSLAVDKGLSKDKKQELEAQGKFTADFINITAFGKLGENIANYMKKGSMIGIQGRIQTGSYNADDGSKRYTFEVVAEKSEFLSWNNDSNSNSNTSNNTTDNGGFDGDGFQPVDDEDIPF